MGRASLKDLAKQVLERQPISGEADVRRAIGKAIEAARLTHYSAALLLGRLQLCGNCAGFQFAADPAALGHCTRFGVEAWPFVAFRCLGFEVSTAPAAPSFLPDPGGWLAIDRELAKPVLPADLPFNDPIPDFAGGAQ